jgi:hypothetical protein
MLRLYVTMKLWDLWDLWVQTMAADQHLSSVLQKTILISFTMSASPEHARQRPRKHKETLADALGADKNQSSPLFEPYIKLARWLGRSKDPFIYFYNVFKLGIETQLPEDIEEDDEDDEDEDGDEDPDKVMYVSCNVQGES